MAKIRSRKDAQKALTFLADKHADKMASIFNADVVNPILDWLDSQTGDVGAIIQKLPDAFAKTDGKRLEKKLADAIFQGMGTAAVAAVPGGLPADVGQFIEPEDILGNE